MGVHAVYVPIVGFIVRALVVAPYRIVANWLPQAPVVARSPPIMINGCLFVVITILSYCLPSCSNDLSILSLA
jgi:hypothetical protein